MSEFKNLSGEGSTIIPLSRERSTSRSQQSSKGDRGKSNERSRKTSKTRTAYSGNSGCSLFGGPGGRGVHDVSREREKKAGVNESPLRQKTHLMSLEQQISDLKKALQVDDETLFLSEEYIKLKLEYANKLADEGKFPQALQEIVDLFVSKHQANKSSVDQKNEEDGHWNKSDWKPQDKEIEAKSKPTEILTPASLQYFVSSLASLTVSLGGEDMGFIRKLNHDPKNIQRTVDGNATACSLREVAHTKSEDGDSKIHSKLYVDFKVSPGQVWNCPWSCPSCSGVLVEPLTLPCGHSYCKKCLIRIAKSNSTANTASCKKCGSKWFPLTSKPEHDLMELIDPQGCDNIPSTVIGAVQILKVNVLVNSLCNKYWGPDLDAVKRRLDANNNFARGNLQEAVDIYSDAVKLAPNDHYALGNRSHIYTKQGQYDKALEDADAAIALRKDWAKGYYRKGLSLHGMGRHEEAFRTFYECLTIEMVCENIDSTQLTYPSLLECAKQLYCVIEQTVNSRMYQKSASLKPKIGNENCFLSCAYTSEQEKSTPSRSSLFNIGFSQPSKHETKERKSSKKWKRRSSLSQVSLSQGSTTGQSDDSSSSDSSSEDESFTRTLSTSVNDFIPSLVRGLVDFVQTMAENSSKLEVVPKPNEEWFVRGLLSYRANYRPIDSSAVDSSDYECPLCMRLLWQPITTPCGHTFCRVCLDRTLDHNSVCPMCKSAEVKKVYLVERREFVPNEFIESSMRRLLPIEYQERKVLQHAEISEFGGGTENSNVIPIFVCTVSLPGIPCPLHVFEPRYRLMVRRAMESGTREFGMSCKIDESPFADYGTMLEIRDVQYFADGRSVIDTVGGRRFKVLSRDTKDGYDTATVEFFQDDFPSDTEVKELQKLHNQVFQTAGKWFAEMSESMKSGILNHYGSLPEPEADYWKLPNGPAWGWWILTILPLDSQLQIQVLSLTSLKRRLEIILRILNCIFRRRKEHQLAAQRRKPIDGQTDNNTI